MSGDVIPVLYLSVVEGISELESSSRNLNEICLGNEHCLLAGIVKDTHSRVVDYVGQWWEVIGGSMKFDLSIDLLQSHSDFGGAA